MRIQVKSRLLKSYKSQTICQDINASKLHIATCISLFRALVLLLVLINPIGVSALLQFPGRDPEPERFRLKC
jgi:hypothetical protein